MFEPEIKPIPMTAYNKNVWIPVKVSAGMFSTEYSVQLTLFGGKVVSFFADKTLVRKEAEDRFTLRVYMMNRDTEKKVGEIMLPCEPLEDYSSRWATVPFDDTK
jgi:hypothetical protein